jgi:hypothetical protein
MTPRPNQMPPHMLSPRGQRQRQPSQRRQPQGVGCEVFLNLYDWKSNKLVAGFNDWARDTGAGAFHAAVEVYGLEWSYSKSSGVYSLRAKSNDHYEFRESIPMGVTYYSPQQVETILQEMGNHDWNHQEYTLLYHNCCHFSDDFCVRLGVGNAPSWVNNPLSY